MLALLWVALPSVGLSQSLAPEFRNAELAPGGEVTFADSSENAFGSPFRTLSRSDRREFFVGNSFFRLPWVSAPSSTTARDGLGPTFNAVSCGSCHTLDGRAPPFNEGLIQPSLLFRVSHPDSAGSWVEDQNYGDQFNPTSLLGVPSEGKVTVTFVPYRGFYGDGTPYELKKPKFTFSELPFGPFAEGTEVSPRLSPHLIGLGLLEAIEDKDILAREDIEDRDKNGISGKANWILNLRKNKLEIGRFGWKANQPTVEQQVAGAFLGDMGLTTEIFPQQNCPLVQIRCRQSPEGGLPEVEPQVLKAVTLYARTLEVPAVRAQDKPKYMEGRKTFYRIGCHECHTPEQKISDMPDLNLKSQSIFPYTDLLLHDMGEELADHRPDGLASGREWKTPPLWGLGLIAAVNRKAFYLHDGRAETLDEAILWHGGEGYKSREKFRHLSAAERESLLHFLKSI